MKIWKGVCSDNLPTMKSPRDVIRRTGVVCGSVPGVVMFLVMRRWTLYVELMLRECDELV
jgi:hypothetical protein